jgi:hypothetical protein
MSDFAGEGFVPFPNTYSDNLHIGDIPTMNRQVLDNKMMEYGAFVQRTDIMNRARSVGDRILNHLIFEAAWRDGVYEEQQNAEIL